MGKQRTTKKHDIDETIKTAETTTDSWIDKWVNRQIHIYVKT